MLKVILLLTVTHKYIVVTVLQYSKMLPTCGERVILFPTVVSAGQILESEVFLADPGKRGLT